MIRTDSYGQTWRDRKDRDLALSGRGPDNSRKLS